MTAPLAARRYRQQHRGMNALDKSSFTRQLHRLPGTLHQLFLPQASI